MEGLEPVTPPRGLRVRLRAGEPLLGTFVNLGSPLAAEICGQVGFDWVLVDLEHGASTESDLVPHLQALAHTGAAPIVRVEANERPRFTRALDAGAEGIMVPRVDSAADARRAVSHLRYPPAGVRGVALMNRAMSFGAIASRPLAELDEQFVGIVQIESESALADAADIAAVDGVDCLFVGPSDLTQSLGIFGQLDHPRFVEAIEAVRTAAVGSGKAAGILARSPVEARGYIGRGYTFVGIGSDSAFLVGSARAAVAAARET
jgi:2-keto-3-deoxy-L-rhamnonate aldolase RhmA